MTFRPPISAHSAVLSLVVIMLLARTSAIALAQSSVVPPPKSELSQTVSPPQQTTLPVPMRTMPRPVTPVPDFNLESNALTASWSTFLFYRFSMPHVDDFAEYEKICDYALSSSHTLSNGKLLIQSFADGFKEFFHISARAPSVWPKDIKSLQDWQKIYPMSSCAFIAEAIYWRAYAWQARGRGYAHDVVPEGWDLFNERLEKGYRVLRDSSKLAASNPVWYTASVETMLDLRRPQSEILSLVAQGLKRYPDHWTPSHLVALRYLPKWGGTWRSVEGYISNIALIADKNRRDEVYAFHYSSIFSNSDVTDLRTNTHVDWERMKSGMRGILARYVTNTVILNSFAALSCRAGDKNYYGSLRRHILNGRYDNRGWTENLVSMDVCDRRFKLDAVQ